MGSDQVSVDGVVSRRVLTRGLAWTTPACVVAGGAPVVPTRCGGMDEVLRTPDTGTIVEVGDVAAMAAALGELTDPERRRLLATTGAQEVREAFDLSRQARVFADAYRKLVGG